MKKKVKNWTARLNRWHCPPDMSQALGFFFPDMPHQIRHDSNWDCCTVNWIRYHKPYITHTKPYTHHLGILLLLLSAPMLKSQDGISPPRPRPLATPGGSPCERPAPLNSSDWGRSLPQKECCLVSKARPTRTSEQKQTLTQNKTVLSSSRRLGRIGVVRILPPPLGTQELLQELQASRVKKLRCFGVVWLVESQSMRVNLCIIP